MKTKETSTREKSMIWWNSLTLEEKFYKVIPWLKSKDINVTERHPNSLTGREIEEIFKIETKHIDPSDIESAYRMQVKPNQK